MSVSTGKTTPHQIKPGQVQRFCGHCDIEFWCYPSKIGKFCSQSCRAKKIGLINGERQLQLRTDPQQCRGCGNWFPLADYTVVNGRPILRCKNCNQSSPESKRRSHLWKNFKITLEEWNHLYELQGGICPICEILLPPLEALNSIQGRSWKDPDRNWNTDHCHNTGRVRAILHRNCNMGLGCFKEDPEIMRRAAKYIARHKKISLKYIKPELPMTRPGTTPRRRRQIAITSS